MALGAAIRAHLRPANAALFSAACDWTCSDPGKRGAVGRRTAACAAIAALALFFAGATGAIETEPLDSGQVLPFPGFTDMAVDSGTGRIFMTGSPTGYKPDFVSTLYVLNENAKLSSESTACGAPASSLRGRDRSCST